MTEKKKDIMMPRLPAWPGYLPRCLPGWRFILCVQARKKPFGALIQADRLLLDGKSKICSLVANAEGGEPNHKINTNHKINICSSFTHISEYQALWPTSLSGPCQKKLPFLQLAAQTRGAQTRNPTDAQQTGGFNESCCFEVWYNFSKKSALTFLLYP